MTQILREPLLDSKKTRVDRKTNQKTDTERRVEIDRNFQAIRLAKLAHADSGSANEWRGTAKTPKNKVRRLAIIPSLAVFSGFAALFALQHAIKSRLGIPDDSSPASSQFSLAVTALYWGQLIFRVGHSLFLGCFSSKTRVVLGIICMLASMVILLVAGYIRQTSLSVVLAAYGLGGCAVATFEVNYIVLLGGLGNQSKLWGISGIPLGIFTITVVGFGAMQAGVSVLYLYAAVSVMLVLSLPVALFLLPSRAPISAKPSLLGVETGFNLPVDFDDIDNVASPKIHSAARVVGEADESTPRVSDLRGWSLWAGSSFLLGLCFMLNMICVTAFSPGVLLYIHNTATVDMGHSILLKTFTFFSLFSCCSSIGDLMSRRVAYHLSLEVHPIYLLSFSILGLSLVTRTQVPALAPVGTFLIFCASGGIYAQSCRRMDAFIQRKYAIAANSLFFFMGDIGSITGATLIPFIKDLLI